MDTTHPSPHRRAWDTLPWLAAGSASADDAAQAWQHLGECSECRAELAFHQQLRVAMQAQGADAQPLPEPGPGFQRLLARLDVAEGAAAADAVRAAPAAQAAHAPGRGAPSAAAPWTRWLVAAVMVQAVGLGAAGLVLLQGHREADYRTLSQPTAPVRAASVRLVPAPGMDFAALRSLLDRTRMDVVEASPDGGSLGLAPQDGAPGTTAAALPVLRADPQVVLAEPLQ